MGDTNDLEEIKICIPETIWHVNLYEAGVYHKYTHEVLARRTLGFYYLKDWGWELPEDEEPSAKQTPPTLLPFRHLRTGLPTDAEPAAVGLLLVWTKAEGGCLVKGLLHGLRLGLGRRAHVILD